MSGNVVVLSSDDLNVYVLVPSDGDALKLAKEEGNIIGNRGRIFIEAEIKDEGQKGRATKDIDCYICDKRYQKINVER